jgi:hypothetical protein
MKELGWPECDLKKAQKAGTVNFRKVGGKLYLYGATVKKQAALKVVK